MAQTINLICLGCGAPLTLNMKECPSCYRPVVISTFNSVYSMPDSEVRKYARTYENVLKKDPENSEVLSSIAMCYLKQKLYDKALSAFERAIEADFDNSEIYFYAAVCHLKGNKAFIAKRSDIDRAIEYINAAISIEPRGIYYYFLAYIKYDFFSRKFLNTKPDYRVCVQEARNYGTSEYDRNMLFSVLGVQDPCFF